MESQLEVLKPSYIAIGYVFPEVGKSYICYELEKDGEKIVYKMARISNVTEVNQIYNKIFMVKSKKSVYYIQVLV